MAVPKNHEQPHFRKIIRHRVVDLLKQHVDVAERVYPSRPVNLFKFNEPAILVYFTFEDANTQNIVPRNYLRSLTVVTEVLHNINPAGVMALDDYLDSRAFEIEHALADDRYLGLENCIEDTILVRTEPLNYSGEGDRTIASLKIFWEIKYRTDFNFHGEIDEFLKFNTKYNLKISPDSDDAMAEDMVIIRDS